MILFDRFFANISSRYVKDFDALHLLALAETALLYEVPLLRDAIWQHYARQISLKVTNPVSHQLYFDVILWQCRVGS